MLRRPGRGHLFGRVCAQTVLTALTFAVPKGTDRGIENEVAPATTHFPRLPDLPLSPGSLCRKGRKGARPPSGATWAPAAASCAAFAHPPSEAMLLDRAADDHLSISGSGCPALLPFAAADASRCSTRRRPGSPASLPMVSSPAAPQRLTRRPHRSCRPYCRATSRPLGSEPSAARLASPPLPRLPLNIPARATLTAMPLAVPAHRRRIPTQT
jgi:hypothetical protein